jgi:deaminated glutathione amidase
MARSVRAALVQLRSGMAPEANLAMIAELTRAAVAEGASYVLTPEMSVAFAHDRETLKRVALPFKGNPVLAEMGALAASLGIFLHLGSMAVALRDKRFANRAVLFAPDGKIVASYDKIHLFDADPPGDNSYRESEIYRPGKEAVVAKAAGFRLGFSICYDLRFPALYTALAEAGAEVLAVPAAFTVPTGEAHWQVLLKARAIETGAFVLAAAQGGTHENGRRTYGHSLIVDPWGRILAERANDTPGIVSADLDLGSVREARRRLPALANRRVFSLSVNKDRRE